MSRDANAELKERRGRLARTEARIKGLVSFIADGDRSDALVSGLRDLEAQARSEHDAIAGIERDAATPVELPNVGKIMSRVFDLQARLTRDPARAREELRALLRNGEIRMRVEAGRYLARGTLFPYGLVISPKTQYGAGGKSAPYYGFSSGGRRSSPSHATRRAFSADRVRRLSSQRDPRAIRSSIMPG